MNCAIDFTGRLIDFDCMSCDIAEHKLLPPGGMIYEDDFVTLAGDVEVPIVGFIILAPKKHVVSITELTIEERYHLLNVLNESIEALKKLGICKRVNIIQEEKHHLHIWILPVHSWMQEKKLGTKNIGELFKYAKNIAINDGVYDVMYAIQRLKTYFNNFEFTTHIGE